MQIRRLAKLPSFDKTEQLLDLTAGAGPSNWRFAGCMERIGDKIVNFTACADNATPELANRPIEDTQ